MLLINIKTAVTGHYSGGDSASYQFALILVPGPYLFYLHLADLMISNRSCDGLCCLQLIDSSFKCSIGTPTPHWLPSRHFFCARQLSSQIDSYSWTSDMQTHYQKWAYLLCPGCCLTFNPNSKPHGTRDKRCDVSDTRVLKNNSK